MRFLIACGASAGHIYPGVAAADALKALLPGSEFLFVGAGHAMEKRLVPEAGYELRNIPMTGLERRITPSNLAHDARALWLLGAAMPRARRILRSWRPDFVLGTGGHICYPVLTAAAHRGIPTAIHNSDALPGLTSVLLSKTVTRVFTGFPDTESAYRDPSRV
ncbi:MAG: glycosyltransferase, partial [Oscillospiraceae bacterium]|nr:glycosyltransferase [Oscillospiraceae bacterium]